MDSEAYPAEHPTERAGRPRRRPRARWVVLAVLVILLAIPLARYAAGPSVDGALASDVMTNDREVLGLKYELDSVREDAEGRTVYRFVASDGPDGPLEVPVPIELACVFYWVPHVECAKGGMPVIYDPGWNYRISNWDENFHALVEDDLVN